MLTIYNTLTRQKQEFKPLKKNKAGLYTCGPTVYNYAHIGNLRTYVFEDILKRSLLFLGYKVKHVMNITDVGHLTSDADTGEDKMEKGAKREGKTAWDIARFYTEAFEHDIAELNILPPDIYCRATDYIKEQINLIKKLEKKSFTYITSDGVYFDTAKFPDYGKMANLKNQELKAGARVDMGDKKSPNDFALWKFSHPLLASPSGRGRKPEPTRQMEWESPWGVGFPGWHIECSAMSVKFLGQPFDIHCGGIDHIPVHHTNEIAQSEATTGKPLANYWIHGEYLLTGNDKMAKSGDNFLTISTLKEKGFDPLAYRFFLLQTHYRKQLNFSWEALEAAQNGYKHLLDAVANCHPNHGSLQGVAQRSPVKMGGIDKNNDAKISQKFTSILEDDLNLPEALALVWDAIKTKTISQKTLFEFDKVLGLGLAEAIKSQSSPLPDAVAVLLAQRNEARARRDFKASDELRAQIEALGFEVKDTTQNTQVTKR
ncbi:MAG: cysteine--tRNA ligase [Candidatus Magasanikbacteria bacterium RIFOXYD2_FULL_41_14]|uniref:Cysteine--tRNA ligase n=1 Tax=Candidatus Magasanikbacteria bacterium RIFOXYD2_FULL_41_14 TaxID=1798709 RepID=A0A1F6PGC9_9BACT|nr:MAG: cysteine--tRNA ligase [Candidatus Magasanikbacteria bacterium RIFOXYD2_FULL_41_14]